MLTAKLDPRRFVSPGSVTGVARTPHGLLLDVGDERFRVDVIRADTLRLKWSRAGRFDEAPTFATSFEMAASPAFDVRDEHDAVTLSTERMKLVITKAAFSLAAHRADGSVLFEDAREDVDGRGLGYIQENDTFTVSRRIGPHDPIYGLGEKTGKFDRRGRKFILWNIDVLADDVLRLNRLYEGELDLPGTSPRFDPYYASIPFFHHCQVQGDTACFAGFFIDNGYKANFDFSGRSTYSYRFEGGQYTEYVFAGPSMREVLEAYTFVTGRMQAPPAWALGHHQCRWHGYSQRDVLALAERYRSSAIPCDVLWLDIEHMDGYRVFTWNKDKFPNVTALSTELAERGFRLVTIVDPGIKYEPGYPVFDEARRRDLLCKTESGQIYWGEVWPGRTAFPDFSKAETREYWANLNAEHAAKGVAGIWNDMNEPATGRVSPFDMRFAGDGGSHPHERFHNQYGLLMAMATRQGLLRARPNERTFILSRAGFSGIQRYAAQWLGDNESEFAHLAMSVPMAAGMGVSGQPFVGADIPGFNGTPTAELAARWIQYGALTPFCRNHSVHGQLDQYPWSFGRAIEELSRGALELRYRLMPYIYSAFMRASESGDPIQRPLVYDFSGDRLARETEDQYLFGDALLVAPVLEPGQTARNVYLPSGAWYDWFTGERHAGGRFVLAPAPLDRIPLFARGGHVIPMNEHAPHSTMGHHPEKLELHVFPAVHDGQTHSHLHEDDGLSFAFESGAYLRTTFECTRAGSRLTLTSTTRGHGFPEFRRRALRLRFHGVASAEARLNGRAVHVEGGVLEFENSGEPFELSLTS